MEASRPAESRTMVAIPPPLANKGLSVIADFLAVLGRRHTHSSLYRGHDNSGHTPSPKAFREDCSGFLSDQLKLDVWKKTIRRCAPVRPANDLEFFVLAQHYGVATALLDWTSSPLVALFFACHSGPHESGEIWQLDSMPLPDVTDVAIELFDHKNSGYPWLIDGTFMNPRSKVQVSMMTLHSDEERSAPTEAIYRVGPGDKPATIHALELFGITAASIFDDPVRTAESFQSAIEFRDFGAMLG